jgi:hypothetical protein
MCAFNQIDDFSSNVIEIPELETRKVICQSRKCNSSNEFRGKLTDLQKSIFKKEKF